MFFNGFFLCTFWQLSTTSEVWNCFIMFERSVISPQLWHSNPYQHCIHAWEKKTTIVQNNPTPSHAHTHPARVNLSNATLDFWFNFPRVLSGFFSCCYDDLISLGKRGGSRDVLPVGLTVGVVHAHLSVHLGCSRCKAWKGGGGAPML